MNSEKLLNKNNLNSLPLLKRSSVTNWKLDNINIFERIAIVGKGTFGTVYKARLKKDLISENIYNSNICNKRYYGLKMINMQNEKEGFPITALREIMLLKKIKHENVVELLDIVISSKKENLNSSITANRNLATSDNKKYTNSRKQEVYLVFDYMEHDICGILERGIELSSRVIKYIVLSVIKGLDYLHKNNILHRDIKSSNILINNKGDVKITDFGLAKAFNPNLSKMFTNRVVTLWYRAPELLLGSNKYDCSVDIWSLGCFLLELYIKKPPFRGKKELEQLNIIYENCGSPDENSWPDISKLPFYEATKNFKKYDNSLTKLYMNIDKIDGCCLDLIKKMLTVNPSNRITIKEILEHKFFEYDIGDKSEFPDIELDSHEYQVKKLHLKLNNKNTNEKNNTIKTNNIIQKMQKDNKLNKTNINESHIYNNKNDCSIINNNPYYSSSNINKDYIDLKYVTDKYLKINNTNIENIKTNQDSDDVLLLNSKRKNSLNN